jgi:hypothetical protein
MVLFADHGFNSSNLAITNYSYYDDSAHHLNHISKRVVVSGLSANFENFGDQCTELRRARDGLLDVELLGVRAQTAVFGDPVLFERYFQKGSELQVLKVFDAALLAIFRPGFMDEFIPYPPPPTPRWDCDENPTLEGYEIEPHLPDTMFWSPDQAAMILCPYAFAIWEDLQLRTCKQIGTRASDSLVGLGAVILHELLHWSYPQEYLWNWALLYDWNDDRIRGWYPPNGYGAWWAAEINRISTISNPPNGQPRTDPLKTLTTTFSSRWKRTGGIDARGLSIHPFQQQQILPRRLGHTKPRWKGESATYDLAWSF